MTQCARRMSIVYTLVGADLAGCMRWEAHEFWEELPQSRGWTEEMLRLLESQQTPFCAGSHTFVGQLHLVPDDGLHEDATFFSLLSLREAAGEIVTCGRSTRRKGNLEPPSVPEAML